LDCILQARVAELKEAMRTPARVVITTHQGPDGDAIGSMLALYWFLTKAGYEVFPVVPSDYPAFLHWMPGNEHILNYIRHKERVLSVVESADWLFYLDFNHLNRTAGLNQALAASKARKVLIDHHLAPDIEVEYEFSDPLASSTACLLFYMMLAWEPSLTDATIATCAYTGLMTDTGCFSYNIRGPETFDMVSRLMQYGIDRDGVYRKVYDNFSESRMRLLGYCLNETMEVFPKYATALISLSLEDQKKYSFVVGDSESFVNYPLSIAGVNFSAFFQEKEDRVKISFRSRGAFSANDFARAHFDGGGHRNASGGESRLSLKEAMQQFRDLLHLYEYELNK
jgi:phosphoesterase RecJ-like protein